MTKEESGSRPEVEAYDAALRYGEVTARVHGNLALSLNALGRVEEAEAHNRKARQLAVVVQ